MRFRAIFLALILAGAAPLARADQENFNRAMATLERMTTVATAIEAYMTDADKAPEATTVEALQSVLSPTYIKNLPTRDGWDTPLRYVRTGEQSFQIISAGSDRKFDEKSWSVPARTANLADDAVYAKTTAPGAFIRIWLDSHGRPLLLTKEESAALVQPIVDAEIEKMKGMTAEESFSYLRTSSTAQSMRALAVAIEEYRLKKGSYPPARSMADLERALFPEFVPEVRKTDYWGTELRYLPSSDGKSYSLISAGADHTFDEKSWDKPGPLASADDDAVIRNGEFIRVWDGQTRPGDTPEARRRKALNPTAHTLLERADALRDGHDYAGALDAYMQAVKTDPAAADLALIKACVPATYSYENAEREAEQQRIDKAVPHEIAALRQYLQLRPGDWDATQMLLPLIPLPEAESLLEPYFKSRPSDPDLYALRGTLRGKHGLSSSAVDDYVKASELDPKNPERYYVLGVVAYEAVTKDKNLTDSARRNLTRTGVAALARAETLKEGYFESMAYHGLLLRQEALLEKDPKVQKKLTDEADALRQRAVEIIQHRRDTREKP